MVVINNVRNSKIETWFDVAQKRADVPIEINSNVVAEIKLLIKEHELKKSDLVHCDYRAIIRNVLKQNRIPVSLAGVPFIETRFKNLPGEKNAGFWNFSVYTAQMYGLVIDEKMDERLNINKSSQVAAKYLGTLYEIFKNWNLVILAYRYGEGHILQKVREFPSATAWEIEAKIETQENYLSRFIAAVIFLENDNCE